MPFDARLYPPEWRAMRAEKLKAVSYCCQGCGAADRSVGESAEGNPYMVHLSIAHRNQYETWKADAETMVLCQACHRRFDRKFTRKAGTRRYHTPIGYASVYTYHRDAWCLVDMPRTLDDLRDVVAALPAHHEFEVQCLVMSTLVGSARYRKALDGSLHILTEQGACIDLACQLEAVSVPK